jgi:hypothetical protein
MSAMQKHREAVAAVGVSADATPRPAPGVVPATSLHGRLASAQKGYRNRPVKLVILLAAGAGLDYFARVTGEKLSSYRGQPVLVENCPAPVWRLVPTTS